MITFNLTENQLHSFLVNKTLLCCSSGMSSLQTCGYSVKEFLSKQYGVENNICNKWIQTIKKMQKTSIQNNDCSYYALIYLCMSCIPILANHTSIVIIDDIISFIIPSTEDSFLFPRIIFATTIQIYKVT